MFLLTRRQRAVTTTVSSVSVTQQTNRERHNLLFFPSICRPPRPLMLTIVAARRLEHRRDTRARARSDDVCAVVSLTLTHYLA